MRLFAEMLAALPADARQCPTTCSMALRPIEAADVDRCAEMAGEFAFATRPCCRACEDHASGPWLERASALALVRSRRNRTAWRAEQYARVLRRAAPRAMLRRRAADATSALTDHERAECIASADRLHAGRHRRAGLRSTTTNALLDFAAHLRLAATLLVAARIGDADARSRDASSDGPRASRSAVAAAFRLRSRRPACCSSTIWTRLAASGSSCRSPRREPLTRRDRPSVCILSPTLTSEARPMSDSVDPQRDTRGRRVPRRLQHRDGVGERAEAARSRRADARHRRGVRSSGARLLHRRRARRRARSAAC